MFYTLSIGSVISHIVKCSKSLLSNRTWCDDRNVLCLLSSIVATSHKWLSSNGNLVRETNEFKLDLS